MIGRDHHRPSFSSGLREHRALRRGDGGGSIGLANYGVNVGYIGFEPTVAIGSRGVVHESSLDDEKQTQYLKD
jgi:hypothetical protein